MRLAIRGLSIGLLLTVALTPLLLLRLLLAAGGPPITSIAFAPDGAELATACQTIGIGENGNEIREIRVYDMGSGRERRAARRVFPRDPVKFGPDGRSIAARSMAGPISIADLARWPYRILCNGTQSSLAALFSPDGRTLVTLAPPRIESFMGSDRGPLHLWDVATGDLRGTLGIDMPTRSLVFSPDGRTLAASPPRDEPWSLQVRPSPNAKALAALGPRLLFWDVEAGRLRATTEFGAACGPPVAMAPDGEVVAASSADGVLTLWGLTDGRIRGTIPGLEADAVAFSPDGRRLAVAGDEAVEVWELATMRRITRYNGHSQAWSITLGKRLGDLFADRSADDYSNRFATVAFSPDGRSIASADLNGDVRVWDAASGRERFVLAHRYEYEGPEQGPDCVYTFTGLWACAWACVGLLWLRPGKKSVARPDEL